MTQAGDHHGDRLCDRNRKLRYRCDHNSTILDVLRSRGWSQVDEETESWHLFWCEVTQVRATLDSRRLDPDQKIPHFRNHYELTRKNLLARNLKRLRRLYSRQGLSRKAELCDCMPVTFELPGEYLMFVEEYRRNPGATWIVKPATGCRGRGIFLFQKLKDLVEWRSRDREKEEMMQQLSAEPETAPETYVVQRYVERPYLLTGRKFDLRIYVLVTSFHPLKAWLAREGFARLSVAQYSLNLITDNRVHLTNTAIQLRNNCRGMESGCKWSLRSLREYLTACHGAGVVENLVQEVAQVVLTSLHSVSTVITQDRHCFELYGYDILLDQALKPWLLEVNASPSLTATDPDDYHLKYTLLQDALNVLDFEGRLTGRERRVGGLDLIWDGGPVRPVFMGAGECDKGTSAIDSTRINAFLGCVNDRELQLNEVWMNAASVDSSSIYQQNQQ